MAVSKASLRFTQTKKQLVLMALAALLLPLCAARAADKPQASSPRAKKGDALFRQNCALCHNKQPGDTTPFGPPNLHGVLRNKTITPAQAVSIIKAGKGQMPPFESRLTESEIQDLLAYLKTQ
jgi:mono/diheme cytochrome c family protein